MHPRINKVTSPLLLAHFSAIDGRVIPLDKNFRMPDKHRIGWCGHYKAVSSISLSNSDDR